MIITSVVDTPSTVHDSLEEMFSKEKYKINKREHRILTKLNVQQIE